MVLAPSYAPPSLIPLVGAGPVKSIPWAARSEYVTSKCFKVSNEQFYQLLSQVNLSSASWLKDDSVPVIFSCFLQYCTYLWNNCQCCCPAAGWKTELFVCDWKLYLSCWGGKMGCMLTLIGEIPSENTITNGCICAHVCLLVCLLTYLLGPTT